MGIKANKLKKNKKGIVIPLEFLITIIIAILLLIPALNFAKNLFRLSSQGTESYTNLVEKINEVGKLHGKDVRAEIIRLDEETAIIGFSSKATYTKALNLRGDYVKFDKPAECQGKNCVCLCRKVDLLKGRDLSCESKMICSVVDYELATTITLTQPVEPKDETYFDGGFIMLRFEQQKIIASPNYVPALKNNAESFGIGYPKYLLSKTRTAYIQKFADKSGKEVIAVCETQFTGPGICEYSQLKS